MLFSVASEVAQHRHLFLLLSKYRDVVGWSTTWKPNSVLCIYLSDLTTHFLKVPESVPDCFSHFKPSHFKSSINTQHNDVNMKCNFRGIICTNIQNCLRRHNHVPVCFYTSSGERLEVYATCFLMERKTFPVSDFIGLSGCVFFSYESSESPGESNQPDRIFWGPGWQCDSYL